MSTERRVLLEAKGLDRYVDDAEPPYRELWLSGNVQMWIDNDLSTAVPPVSQNGRWQGEDGPVEQVYMAFHAYAYDPLYKGAAILANIKPQSRGVWEIKTPDVRIFGWFYRPRVFIAHIGELKANVKYDACRSAVVAFRQGLRLPPPEFWRVKGGMLRDYL